MTRAPSLDRHAATAPWATAAAVVAALAAGPGAAEAPHDLEPSALHTAAAPYLLIFQRAGRTMEITGVAEGRDGAMWVTGYIHDRDRTTGAGYLASIGRDGRILTEHEITLPDGSVTQFWWPAPLADGSVAVATAIDPFTERPNGALTIVAADGHVLDRVLLTEMGLPGGDVVHVEAYPNRDLAIAGSASLGPVVNGAMAARLRPDLTVRWLATERARDRDYTLAAYASVILRDESVVVIGTATRADAVDGYGWLARFDANGRVLWRQWLTGGMADLLEDAAQIYGNWIDETPLGEIVYLQSSVGDFGEPVASTLVRRSLTGHIVDQIPLTFAEPLDVMTMAATRDGDVIVAGAIDGAVPTVARIGPDGSVRWSQRLDDLPSGFVWGVAEASDGGILAVGTYFPNEFDSGSGWVVRFGSDGARP